MTDSPDQVPLYADRLEWQDVTPLRQYENVDPLAPIFYTPEYQDATDYFRAIVKSGEKSPRVLELTESVIRLNPAHYSAWQYRYETLLALKSPLDVEFALMDEFAVKYLKTYQVWHHRRLLLLLQQQQQQINVETETETKTKTPTRTPEKELRFLARSLRADAKNYHTWSYRQWVLAEFGVGDGGDEGGEGLWAGERAFVEGMLSEDVRNNSAWHHLFFVVWACGVREGEADRERILERELRFVKQHISLAPNNPSAWNYLRGILDHTKAPYARVLNFVRLYCVSTVEEAYAMNGGDIVDVDNPPPAEGADLPCVAAVEFLADIYEREKSRDGVLKAVELWKTLANEHDTIRKKYWDFRAAGALVNVKE